MKKLSFSVVALALVATSCSNEEPSRVNAVEDGSISFNIVSPSRAIDIATNDLLSVNVFASTTDGSKYFSDITFAKATVNGSDVFVATPAQFWPTGSTNLNFYTYSANDATGTQKGISDVNFTGTEASVKFTVQSNLADQIDLLAGIAEDKSKTQSVALNLNHKLSKINIKATNTTAYNIEVKGVRLYGMNQSATYSLKADSWSSLTRSTSTPAVQSTFAGISIGSTLTDITGTDYDAMVIPQSPTWWADKDVDNARLGEVCYISLLVKITSAENAEVWPNANSSYASGVDGFAWALIPIEASQVLAMQNNYTLTVNFKDGFGKVDPDQDNDGELDDNPDEDTNPNNDDDPKPGDDVIPAEAEIMFTVTVEDWTTGTISNVNI